MLCVFSVYLFAKLFEHPAYLLPVAELAEYCVFYAFITCRN